MPTITIGKTNKRINSTKQDFISGTSKNIDVTLKEPCTMQNPVFKILRSSLPSGLTYDFFNYISWGSWYYWIDDMVYINNDMLEVHCHLDPLATYKSSIQDTSAFVSYGDLAHWNELYDDPRISPEMFKASHDIKFDLFDFDSATGKGFKPSKVGCILMTFVQTSSVCWFAPWDAQGVVTDCGIHTALLTIGDFTRCMADLINFDFSGGLIEIQQVIARLMQSTGGGPLMENIKRVIWLPFDYDGIKMLIKGDNDQQYRYGLMLGGSLAPNVPWYEVKQNAIFNFTGELKGGTDQSPKSIGTLVDECTDGLNVLRNDRFISFQISTPSGYQNIGTEKFLYPVSSSIKIYYSSSICLNDGAWAMKLSSTNSFYDTIASFSGNLGINIQGTIYDGPTTSSMIADTAGRFVGFALTAGVGSVVGGALAGESMNTFKGYTKEGIKQYATHLSGGVSSEMQRDQLMNGISGVFPSSNFNCNAPSGNYGGTAAALFLTPTPAQCGLRIQVYAPKFLADLNSAVTNYKDFCDLYGYPVNKFMPLKKTGTGAYTVMGYVQCVGASVAAAGASEASKATINSCLNNGIFIE